MSFKALLKCFSLLAAQINMVSKLSTHLYQAVIVPQEK